MHGNRGVYEYGGVVSFLSRIVVDSRGCVTTRKPGLGFRVQTGTVAGYAGAAEATVEAKREDISSEQKHD